MLEDEGRAIQNDSGPIFRDASNQDDANYLRKFNLKFELLKYCIFSQNETQQSITDNLEIKQNAMEFVERVQ